MNKKIYHPPISVDAFYESIVSFMKQNNLKEFGGFSLEEIEVESKTQREERKEFIEAQQIFLSKKDSFHSKQNDRFKKFSILMKMLKARYGKEINFQSVMDTFSRKTHKKKKVPNEAT